MPLALLQYWKVALLAVLLAAIGVQTWRLNHAKEALHQRAQELALYQANIDVARAYAKAEGIRQQQEAQKALDAAAAKIEAARLASIERRARSAEARAKQLESLLKDAEWDCLVRPLPPEFLNEYR